ncbi:hypothetical protein O3M35_012549 [Rhynocoris fuscipes]|uniref:HYDIN/VesB/CFA65-like Ig-like domain-containing protein n=1 Tax=Rhynocoris fuscipes TaxID=488301 RepID=A0AAW1CW89_9HEMI
MYDTTTLEEAKDEVITFDTMMFLRIFLDLNFEEPLEITPSVYLREMSYSHQDRQLSLRSPTRKHNHLLSFNCPPYIKLSPPIVVFQNCEPDEISSIRLSVMNIGVRPVSLQLKVDLHEAFTIKAVRKGDVLKKLAKGIEQIYEIGFRPILLKDYFQTLKFITTEDKFDVPIYGKLNRIMGRLGPRALIDFPDVIEMPQAPVKLRTSKTIILKNIGRIPGIVNLTTDWPFSLQPEKVYLDVEQEMAWVVNFLSFTKGMFYKKITARFENGEQLSIDAVCSADNLNIYLSSDKLDFDDVYVGKQKSLEIEIHNESAFLVKYNFHVNKTVSEDIELLKKINSKFNELKEIGYSQSAAVDHYDLTLPGMHQIAYDRIFKDQFKFSDMKDLTFKNVNFEIIPNTGEIWPWTSTLVTVIFSPSEVTKYKDVAYCDVEGKEERMILNFRGLGIGPLISLNVDSIDLGFIFLCSEHKYEIIALNKGGIPGTLKFVHKNLMFGGKLNCYPEEFTVAPGELKLFVISISSSTAGQFVEEAYFQIVESEKVLKCVLKGKVVSPLLTFDTKCVDFGDVPLGFPVCLRFSMHNSSPVKVPFEFRILHDGVLPAKTCWEVAKSKKGITYTANYNAKEFTLTPSKGEIEPHKSVEVKVSLITYYIVSSLNISLQLVRWHAPYITLITYF